MCPFRTPLRRARCQSTLTKRAKSPSSTNPACAPWYFFRNRNKNRNRNRKTATARRRQATTRDNKENRGQTAAQWIEITRNDKQQQEEIVCHYLVRMRSAVQIRPAAPGKPCNRNGCRVLSFLIREQNRLQPCLWLLFGYCP